MRHIRKAITFIILTVLAASAAAATSKCTSAQGKVIYTNAACPPGYEEKRVGENISVVDSSAERALIAREIEKAKTEASADNSGNEIAAGDPATDSLSPANLAMLKGAESLGQTAFTARERLVLAAAILIGIAAIFRILFRRKK